MTVDEAIKDKQCNMFVEVKEGAKTVFYGTIGELQARTDIRDLTIKNGPAFLNNAYRIDV